MLWSFLSLPVGAGGREAMGLRGEMVMGSLSLTARPSGGSARRRHRLGTGYRRVCKTRVGLSGALGTTGEEQCQAGVSGVLFLN